MGFMFENLQVYQKAGIVAADTATTGPGGR
jgi:hypothetical protein